ncbi:cysteinyl-tRNA synthetase [Coprinopsis cinerea okayama7|uniref:cysteine--tRNA ligase n=1 Tax=Coprinopsis cinerea (strain Okayama-7 / 130 / ATCC MYA-4618 / FGSC 9003) TaxID=240176 RepID=A8N799_COPC7|nr:cysteinyl-tRNA synthetase [Coprinopsis cinerea okayama7\|eukprot:XP_001830705.2 cysteinyl-tRNA synthetase [Coprinopsis cinerea okayama7\
MSAGHCPIEFSFWSPASHVFASRSNSDDSTKHRALHWMLARFTRCARVKPWRAHTEASQINFHPVTRRFCSHGPSASDTKRSEDELKLLLYNSLTKSKTEVTSASARPLKWYSCGPTVYDTSHLGHARNYVTQDVMRRILTDYFGLNIQYVMNVTDIDDKIIERTRQHYFLDKFRQKHTRLTLDLISEVEEAVEAYCHEHLTGLPNTTSLEELWSNLDKLASDQTWLETRAKESDRLNLRLASIRRCREALKAVRAHYDDGVVSTESAHQLIEASSDILGPALNHKSRSQQLDPGLYRRLAAHWEAEFFSDMAKLNVVPPDVVTRVTDYVPEIINFIDRIIQNGYAYSVGGNVYFDIRAFNQAPGHQYGKLIPWNENHGGMDDAGDTAPAAHKKSPSDFALWKASKPGEPFWESPWGPGRPGWHIECSAMATAILGEKLDIHSGGIDLLFPHHTNELAQSEAYFKTDSWVDCFIHTGHLHIQGLKMSKSLKNFISIKDILQCYTADQLRLAFLLHPWHAKFDFSDEFMKSEVLTLEAFFANLFSRTRSLARAAQSSYPPPAQHFGAHEAVLRTQLEDAKVAFRSALANSIDSVGALNVLRKLTSQTNIYIDRRGDFINVALLGSVTRWITKMLQLFGLTIGDASNLASTRIREDEREAIVYPYLEALAKFRDGVRQLAKASVGPASGELLMLCDQLRDEVLPPLGVSLEDKPDGNALVKLVPPRTAKSVALAGSSDHTAETKRTSDRPGSRRSVDSTVNPRAMFTPPHVEEGVYSSWDEEGLPLTDGEGQPISKNRRKRLHKLWKSQYLRYQQHMASQSE